MLPGERGSRGNAMLVERAGTCLMIDCGLSAREAERRLVRTAGRAVEEVTAISESNNRAELARAALGAVLGCDRRWIAVARQDTGLQWREIA